MHVKTFHQRRTDVGSQCHRIKKSVASQQLSFCGERFEFGLTKSWCYQLTVELRGPDRIDSIGRPLRLEGDCRSRDGPSRFPTVKHFHIMAGALPWHENPRAASGCLEKPSAPPTAPPSALKMAATSLLKSHSALEPTTAGCAPVWTRARAITGRRPQARASDFTRC